MISLSKRMSCHSKRAVSSSYWWLRQIFKKMDAVEVMMHRCCLLRTGSPTVHHHRTEARGRSQTGLREVNCRFVIAVSRARKSECTSQMYATSRMKKSDCRKTSPLPVFGAFRNYNQNYTFRDAYINCLLLECTVISYFLFRCGAWLFCDCSEPGIEVKTAANVGTWQKLKVSRATSRQCNCSNNQNPWATMRSQLTFRDCRKPNKKVRLWQMSVRGKKVKVSCVIDWDSMS